MHSMPEEGAPKSSVSDKIEEAFYWESANQIEHYRNQNRKLKKHCFTQIQEKAQIEGTLMQIWKSSNTSILYKNYMLKISH